MIDLNIQILILFYSFLSGIIFGLCFDIYRMVFKSIRNKILGLLRDAFYWILIGMVVFYFLLYTQYAILSVYTYFYIFLGALFYLKCVSRFIFDRTKKILYGLAYFLRYLFKSVCYEFSRFIGKKNY